MKLRIRLRCLFILLFLLSVAGGAFAIEDYPAECRTTANLNVRSYPSQSSYKIGTLPQYSYVTVKYTVGSSYDTWGVIQYGERDGFISMRYVERVEPAPESQQEVQQEEQYSSQPNNGIFRKISRGFESFFKGLWTLIKWGLIIILILMVIAFKDLLIQLAFYVALFAGVGALVFVIFGGSGGTGAFVGLVVAALVGLRLFISIRGWDEDGSGNTSLLRGIFIGIYYVVSHTFYCLNRIEHFLIAPWRYFFMDNWATDSSKPTWRAVTEGITIVMYVVTTPLRLANAIVYNIFVHCIIGIYDLLYEVLVPSAPDEGRDDVWTWIGMLPYRFIYYAMWHGFLLVLESVIWTVVDIFIPALTFYHGTTLNAANSIICDPERNDYLKKTSGWASGNFMASNTPNRTWAGRGVYFAIKRKLAMDYSGDDRSGLGGDPVMIVCRVSIGRVISYALTPDYIYRQAGNGGWHDEFNKFADANGYTTGEWYNPGGVWEYCLLDWQNGYNSPWRIRPVYILNLRTGLAQHITGGMQHWLFYKNVLDNLLE